MDSLSISVFHHCSLRIRHVSAETASSVFTTNTSGQRRIIMVQSILATSSCSAIMYGQGLLVGLAGRMFCHVGLQAATTENSSYRVCQSYWQNTNVLHVCLFRSFWQRRGTSPHCGCLSEDCLQQPLYLWTDAVCDETCRGVLWISRRIFLTRIINVLFQPYLTHCFRTHVDVSASTSYILYMRSSISNLFCTE
jgi:hypothetical protein